MREIYFDNSATTKPYPEVVELMMKPLTEDYGNTSSNNTVIFGTAMAKRKQG